MKRLLHIALVSVLLTGCTVDDMLKPSDTLNVTFAEAVSPQQVFVGDTVAFNMVVSQNKGTIRRIELVSVDNGLTEVRSNIRFSLIDGSKPLSIDATGNLSREVSTLMMIHPFVIKRDQTLFNKTLQVTYRVYSDSETVTAQVSVFVTSYINNTSTPSVKVNQAVNGYFYDPVANCLYDRTEYAAHRSEIEAVFYAVGTKCYCLNPAAAETETILKGLGIDDYQAVQMRNTQFQKNVLTTTQYYLLDATSISALTVTTAVAKSEIANGNTLNYITADGKKGCIRIRIASSTLMIASKMEGVIR